MQRIYPILRTIACAASLNEDASPPNKNDVAVLKSIKLP